MTKKNKAFIFLSTAVALLPIAMYLAVFDQLPAQMGMQWNAEGGVNWYAPKVVAVFIVPVVLALLQLVTVGIRRNDPKRENASAAMQIIKDWMIPVVSVLMAVYSILQNTGTSIGNAVPLVAIGLTLILVGNFIPKSRQNYTMGIRTPWALNNADNWNKTHRLAGWLWIVGGIVLIISAFIVNDAPQLLMVLLPDIILMVVVPFAYSYAFYRKHGGNTQA
jgi:uncharacterized membrane protein